MTAQRALDKASAAARFFEAEGRTVVGVAFTKDGFKLEFERTEDTINPIDLVDMTK